MRAAVDQRVRELHAERRCQGKPAFMGAAQLRALHWRDSAGDTFPSFGLNPRIASGNQDGERQALLRGLKAWRAANRNALAAWRDGDHEAEFPLGTYRMHTLAECNLATEPILVA